MKLGLVVATLGRLEPLGRLLDSLDGQLRAGDRLVIVAQGRLSEVRELVAAHPLAAFTSVVTSDPGAARGRNAGVAALVGLPASDMAPGDTTPGDTTPPGDFLLNFPNDTTWFPDGALDALRGAYDAAPFDAGALTVIDEHGPKFELPAAGTPLDRWNLWNVIEMGILMRSGVFERIGGFDPEIGTGAPTPWQAGEASDLLLRLIDRGPGQASRFRWLGPEASVGGIADAHGLDAPARRRKLRAYGRGLGRVVTRWRYPLWWRFAFIGGGLAFGLRHSSDYAVLDGWWVFLGRLEGALGRTLGRTRGGSTTAVTR